MAIGGWRDVPALLRHCVVAVYHKSTGGGADGVVRAFKICRDQLAKQGYLYHRGQNQILESIQLTGKGFVRNNEHMREGFSGSSKDKQFENLFKMIEPQLWEYDGAGGRSQPKTGRPSATGVAPAEEAEKLMDNAERISDIAGSPGMDHIYPANVPRKR